MVVSKRTKRDLSKYRNKRSEDHKVISITHPELPPFQPYIENKSKGIRFFFEAANSKEEANSRFHNHLKTIIGAGTHAENNKKESFFNFAVSVLGRESAEFLARLLIKHLEKQSKWSSLSKINSCLRYFIEYLEKLNLSDILNLELSTFANFRAYLLEEKNITKENYFNSLKALFLEEPYFKDIGLLNVMWDKSLSRNIHEIDLELALDQGYSDRIMTQILAYTFYEIENIKTSMEHIKQLSPEVLGVHYLNPNNFEIEAVPPIYYYDKKINELLSSPEKYQTLYLNCIYDEAHKAAYQGRFMNKINRLATKLGMVSEYKSFLKFTATKTIKQRKNDIKRIKKSDLGKNYIEYEKFSIRVQRPIKLYESKISDLLNQGNNGYEILMDNVLLHLKGNPDRKDWLVQRIRKIAEAYNQEEQYHEFLCYLRKDLWGVRQRKEYEDGEIEKFNHSYFDFLSGKSDHLAFLVALYACITYGLNGEVIYSTLSKIDGISTLEYFDKYLGSTEESNNKEKAILLLGYKKRSNFTGLGKEVISSVNVSSPFYKYLELLDSTKDKERELFYELNDHKWQNLISTFCKIFSIMDDTWQRLPSLEGHKFRKVFAGHKLTSLIDEVKSETELIEKLKAALSHKNFDVTVFSYLMKSGHSSHAIDLSIIALTEDLLDSALKFEGEIVVGKDKSLTNFKQRYLCDCTDPTQPTPKELIHLDYCKSFDLCLGCKRSRVFSGHLPRIVYRVLQYEKVMEKTPDLFNSTLIDKHTIALDSLERFKKEHVNGVKLLEEAYIYANKCWVNGQALLPPIFSQKGF
ncbi:hypothetical protein KO525_16705 [Psychrosphaera sp. B3R10]|uniref:hypothetical protein n=1 Tax=unclassified Psychrosphaera TaxID=2641570 RepID=UPI001C0A1C18|nr:MULTISPECIES: hypothetical protein [unclassified Psychrosphaera]MBU2883676.1 hypothetical protein [Psychrosphaera sp. I2R16]MBU2991026.1 hypothetical protein [Psychrosphaera sp. B3R10]